MHTHSGLIFLKDSVCVNALNVSVTPTSVLTALPWSSADIHRAVKTELFHRHVSSGGRTGPCSAFLFWLS